MELLPHELFENVCRYLSPCDIASMMLVDSYAKTIIEHSPALMYKLPLYVTDISDFSRECERELEPLLYSRRKVRRVIVRLKNERIMKYLGIFQKFGNTITSLEIADYTFETIDQLRIVLRFLLKLKTLTVTNVTFQRAENKILNSIVQVPKLSLRELRNIFSSNSDPKIFSLFDINEDTQLRAIRLEVADSSNFQYNDFIATLRQQTKLKELKLKGIADNCDIFNHGHLAASQLDVLEIENCVVGDVNQKKTLVDMVKQQRKLKLLKILNTPIRTSSDIMCTYRQILAHDINELHLDIRDLFIFHRHKFVNRTVTQLIVHGNFAFENLPVFVNFIKMFPNVGRLCLVGGTPIGEKYLFDILSTLRKLEELHIPGFTSRAADSNFSNLQTLECKLHTLVLDFIDFDIKFFGWKNIVSNLRSITKLVVKRDYGKVSNEIIDLIIKNLRLQHLELGIGVVSEKILQNIVNNNYCNRLKVLKIAKIDFDKIGKNFDFSQIFGKNHLLLHLCENEYFERASSWK
ncbi:hypothetical protein HA402_006844 [Bradysia odoriphaga]|nr:hypothetical protein HA402_006844 [Bradysia odoriphaga]